MTTFATPEQFAAANKATVDSLLALANTAFASAERIAALNLHTARAVIEDSVANTKALLGAKDAQEAISLQASIAQPNVEKAVAYSRSVYEIAAQTQEELTKVVEDIGVVFNREPDLLNFDEIMAFLKRWLMDHIVKHDMGYKDYIGEGATKKRRHVA